MIGLHSSPCEAAGEQSKVGQQHPGCGAGDGRLEVLGETAATAEPGEGTLDHPSPGQELEAVDAGRALDDLDRPGATIGDRALQLRAAIDPVGEDMAQAGKGLAQRTQQRHGAMRILDVGSCTKTASRKPCVSVTMWRLRPLMRLPASTPRGPPLSVVGALWLSMMPAEGSTLRPRAWRACMTNWALSQRHVPSSRQR